MSFLNLFYPNLCVSCNDFLANKETVLCFNCRHDIPIIKVNSLYSNEITSVFYGSVLIQKGISFLYYNKDGITKKLINDLKYNNNQFIGVFLGEWFGYLLKEMNFFDDIDVIIPVPLHSSKLKERGYDQLNTFGKTLSKKFNIPYNTVSLKRVSATKTQTLKNRFDRFSNINTKFNLTNLTAFENKHILLIDDVITTGATLEACCKELQKTKNITISIATMAYTKKD